MGEQIKLPIDMVLWCPRCFEQHIDEAKPDVCEECGLDEDLCTAKGDTFTPWLNPPHRSHRCSECNHVWRPAEAPTNGVLKLAKEGERDQSAKPIAFASGKDFDDAVEIATRHATRREDALVEALSRIDLRVNSQHDHEGCCNTCQDLLNRIGDDAEQALKAYKGDKSDEN